MLGQLFQRLAVTEPMGALSAPCTMPMVRFVRSAITKYLVEWDKEEDFGRSQVGGDVSHADAAEWSEVVEGTEYQVRRFFLTVKEH